ncbi:PilN domain-containing protein [Verrucomicrobiota bacterium sgz303538]
MREASTLVLIAGERVVRADFAPGTESPASVVSAPRPRGASMADSVRVALGLRGKIRHPVWVLAGDLWTQSIALNRSQVSGLTDEQLSRALSFEIEPFSGIAISESVLGFRRGRDEVDGAHSFWVVEMTAADRDAIQRTVSEAGGKLMGICHPGGLPRSVSSNGHTWSRLESWGSGLLWITSEGDHGVQVRVVNAPPVRASLPSSGVYEVLSVDGALPVPYSSDLPWHHFSLQEEEMLRLWLQHWRVCLQGKTPSVPVVAPAPPPPSIRKYVMAGAVLELIVVLACLLHAGWAARQKATLNQQQMELANSARQLDDTTKENKALREKLTALQTASQQRARIAARRDSVAALLRALAVTKPEEIVLGGIKAEGASSMIVSGVSLDAAAVDEMSIVLNQSLRAAGWIAQPMQKTARRKLSNSGPWDFSVRVTHEQTNQAPAQVRTASKGGAR